MVFPSRCITKNGVRIYPKNGKVFRFWVEDEKATIDGSTSDFKENTMGTGQVSLYIHHPNDKNVFKVSSKCTIRGDYLYKG